jgi:hypothetical protein
MLSAPEGFEAETLGNACHRGDIHAVGWERNRDSDVHGALLVARGEWGERLRNEAIIGEA